MAVAATTEKTGARPSRAGRRPPTPAWVGTVPFFAYVAVFLVWPTGIVVVDSLKNPNGAWAFSNITELGNSLVRGYFIGSFKLALLSSVAGAVFGAILAYAVAAGDPDGTVRRLYIAVSGVLAQFGGVTLAFAFLVLIGPVGLLFHASWYFEFPWGIGLIYTYFQIPLMVLVFLPAIDGLKVQWREASENLGASAWQYWRHVGGPLLLPAFLGCHAAAVRERAIGLRDHRGLGEPDRLHRAAADPNRAVQRGRAEQRQRGRPARPGHGDHGGRRHDGIRIAAAQGGAMAALASVGETPVAAPAGRPSGMQASRRRRLNLFRYVVFTVFGLFFLLPLLAMARFSLEGAKLGTWSLTAWRQIASYQGSGIPPLLSSIEITLELAAITSVVMLVLLVPTMIWVRLRVQWLARTIEFLCLLPLTIPAIVLVVGLGEIYNRIQRISLSALMLFWVYVILALPYAYRALAAGLSAIDVTTLSEAARSLGASWFTVIVRVIAPNMRAAILNALLLTAALVLGEFTIAYLLLYTNLQVELYSISRNTPNAGVLFSTSLAALLLAFVLLLILSYVGRRRRGRG